MLKRLLFAALLITGLCGQANQIPNWPPATVISGTTVYPLDAIGTGATIAYSCSFKLRSAYAGKACRVQRDSDNTQTDIGFSSNIASVTDYNNFGCNPGGGVHCYPVKFYDQSGNANDCSMSALSNGIELASNGSILFFSNASTTHNTSASCTISAISSGTVVELIQPTASTSGSFPASWGLVDSGTNTIGSIFGPTTNLVDGIKRHNTSDAYSLASYTSGNYYQNTYSFSNTLSAFFQNGVAQSTDTTNLSFTSTNVIKITGSPLGGDAMVMGLWDGLMLFPLLSNSDACKVGKVVATNWGLFSTSGYSC